MRLQATAYSSLDPQKNYGSHIDEALGLQVHLKAINKYRWPVIAAITLFTGIAAMVASSLPPTYRATATLLIETRQAVPMNLDKIVGIDTDNKQYYQTQFEVLKSRNLARRVISEMNLYKHPELGNSADIQPATSAKTNPGLINTEELEKRKVVEAFIARTGITPLKNTNMVRISYESHDSIFSASVANSIADNYIRSYTESRAEMGKNANKLINKRLDELRIELAKSQERLVSYKEVNGLVKIQGNSNRLSEQEIGIITEKLLDAEGETATAKILYDEVARTEKNGFDALLSLPSIDANEMIRKHKLLLQQAELHLEELKNKYGDKHPNVIDVTSRQTAARSNLHSQIKNIIHSTEKNYFLSRQTAASLRAKLEAEKKQMQLSDRSNFELLHLEREVRLNQDLFDTLYTRSREVDEAESINASNALITEYAEAPIHPVSPKKQLITLLALLFSAATSTLLAMLYEARRQGINSTDDVELNLGTRMLGILPRASTRTRKDAGSNALIPGSLPDDSLAFEESIRTIRTSICLEDLQQHRQTIMVTSALPSEGKSTLASHLAYSFSSIEKVLLIECDLRRPSLHQAFNFSNNDGLTQLLNSEASFSRCLKPRCLGNLDVIPAGSIPTKPLDLLTSKRFNRLIELLRQRYDRIIIDSAPVQAVSDALILGQFADSVLYAVKENSTHALVASRGVCRLIEAGISVTGAVVTQVNVKKAASAGGLHYDGFYDYYGYSQQADQLDSKSRKAA